ncbi:hypothetical protein ACJX0J_040007, partial [Zea mays]
MNTASGLTNIIGNINGSEIFHATTMNQGNSYYLFTLINWQIQIPSGIFFLNRGLKLKGCRLKEMIIELKNSSHVCHIHEKQTRITGNNTFKLLSAITQHLDVNTT